MPSRTFEKAVRKRSKQFARAGRGLKGNPDALYALATEAVRDYRDLATRLDETYYITRWDKVLSAV